VTAGQLHALALLAWAFVRRQLKDISGTGPRGIALFRANFDAEKLSRLSTRQRAELATFSRCIACGRCDEGDGARIAESRGAYPGTMTFVLASSRSMPDFVLAEEALRWITDEDLAAKEKICPTAVPMRRIAAFVRQYALSSKESAP
jgi:succinate dehydrogenase/fumarate reductase-like Fe-S protein